MGPGDVANILQTGYKQQSAFRQLINEEVLELFCLISNSNALHLVVKNL